jgi:hypothetical protein
MEKVPRGEDGKGVRGQASIRAHRQVSRAVRWLKDTALRALLVTPAEWRVFELTAELSGIETEYPGRRPTQSTYRTYAQLDSGLGPGLEVWESRAREKADQLTAAWQDCGKSDRGAFPALPAEMARRLQDRERMDALLPAVGPVPRPFGPEV